MAIKVNRLLEGIARGVGGAAARKPKCNTGAQSFRRVTISARRYVSLGAKLLHPSIRLLPLNGKTDQGFRLDPKADPSAER